MSAFSSSHLTNSLKYLPSEFQRPSLCKLSQTDDLGLLWGHQFTFLPMWWASPQGAIHPLVHLLLKHGLGSKCLGCIVAWETLQPVLLMFMVGKDSLKAWKLNTPNTQTHLLFSDPSFLFQLKIFPGHKLVTFTTSKSYPVPLSHFIILCSSLLMPLKSVVLK